MADIVSHFTGEKQWDRGVCVVWGVAVASPLTNSLKGLCGSEDTMHNFPERRASTSRAKRTGQTEAGYSEAPLAASVWTSLSAACNIET